MAESSHGEHKHEHQSFVSIASSPQPSLPSPLLQVDASARPPADVMVSINVPMSPSIVSVSEQQQAVVLLERCNAEGCTECNVYVPPPNTPNEQYAIDNEAACERCHHGASHHRKLEQGLEGEPDAVAFVAPEPGAGSPPGGLVLAGMPDGPIFKPDEGELVHVHHHPRVHPMMVASNNHPNNNNHHPAPLGAPYIVDVEPPLLMDPISVKMRHYSSSIRSVITLSILVSLAMLCSSLAFSVSVPSDGSSSAPRFSGWLEYGTGVIGGALLTLLTATALWATGCCTSNHSVAVRAARLNGDLWFTWKRIPFRNVQICSSTLSCIVALWATVGTCCSCCACSILYLPCWFGVVLSVMQCYICELARWFVAVLERNQYPRPVVAFHHAVAAAGSMPLQVLGHPPIVHHHGGSPDGINFSPEGGCHAAGAIYASPPMANSGSGHGHGVANMAQIDPRDVQRNAALF